MGLFIRFTPHTLALHSVFTAHNTPSHVGFLWRGEPENPETNPLWHRRKQHIKQTQLAYYNPAQVRT